MDEGEWKMTTKHEVWYTHEDGHRELKAICSSGNEAFEYVLFGQGQSVDYATTYGGWSIEVKEVEE